MLRITRTIWDGNDYVPFRWEDWVAEPNGTVFVAERGGRVLGFQHLALQADSVGWLEGIRVEESARGSGVAGALRDAAVEWAAARHVRVLRMSVSDDNEASVRVACRGG